MTDKTSDISEIKKEVKQRPSPPFTTSTLQQQAARQLRFSAKRTMRIAQSLYKKRETIENIISEDRQGFKELLKTNDELQSFVKELLDISKTLADENERLKEYLKNEKNAVVAELYKKNLQDCGILKK